ncbi:MAG: alkaline phosphatase family protein [Fimbriimonadaceae bacterium]|nr:alkaline phosphatase family protein [Fimbriimonadaceae bacterium]
MKRVLPRLAAGVAVLAALAPVAFSQKKAVILSWDGAADWVVDRLLEEGKLPNVARMMGQGAHAESMIAAFPSKTAVGHAAIFTGTWGDVNGVTGNSVPLLPKSEHTQLETQSGFSSAALLAEPIYLTAAKAGKKVVVLSATQSYPEDPYVAELKAAGVPAGNYVSFSGFEHPLFPGQMLDASKQVVPLESWPSLPKGQGPYREISLKLGAEEFFFLFFDDPKDPVQGYDSILVRQHNRSGRSNRGECILKPVPASTKLDAWSPAFHVVEDGMSANVYFRLFSMASDLSKVELYQRKTSALQGAATTEEIESYTDVYGGFHDDMFRDYANGMFGKPLWNGGDGEAERRVVEMVRLDCEFLKRGTRYALKRWKPDLLTHYTPMTDSAGHTWMGILDPDSPSHNAELAAKIWPFYEQVYMLQDDWLGDVLDAVDRDTMVALVSDHGMVGTGRTFNVNFALEKAGLMVRTITNNVELAQTRVFAPPYGDFFVVVNGEERKGGIVPAGERTELLDQAAKALLAARDPATQEPIVTHVWTREEAAQWGGGGPLGGDLYLEFAPGYYPSSRVADVLVQKGSAIGAGSHGFWPMRPKMKAILYLSGGGVPAGTVLAGARQIDVAPTLAKWMGIPPPPKSTGRDLLAGGAPKGP